MDTFEDSLDDMLDYCLEIEQLKAGQILFYRLHFSEFMEDRNYAEEYKNLYGDLLEFDEDKLLEKQAVLQALFSKYNVRLSVNRKFHLIERIEEALKSIGV